MANERDEEQFGENESGSGQQPTDQQKQKFKDLHSEIRKEMTGLISAKGAEGRSEKFATLRDKMRIAILTILTEKQQAIVWDMAGPLFTSAYDGTTLTIPMTGLTVAPPIGSPVRAPPHTAPGFGVFVVVATADPRARPRVR